MPPFFLLLICCLPFLVYYLKKVTLQMKIIFKQKRVVWILYFTRVIHAPLFPRNGEGFIYNPPPSFGKCATKGSDRDWRHESIKSLIRANSTCRVFLKKNLTS